MSGQRQYEVRSVCFGLLHVPDSLTHKHRKEWAWTAFKKEMMMTAHFAQDFCQHISKGYSALIFLYSHRTLMLMNFHQRLIRSISTNNKKTDFSELSCTLDKTGKDFPFCSFWNWKVWSRNVLLDSIWRYNMFDCQKTRTIRPAVFS